MAHWRRIIARLRSLVANKRAEEDLAREVASHLTLIADEFERRGMSPEEARLAARRAYGGVEQAKQAHRDERSLLWIEQAMQDLRYGLRTLCKNPGFSITAVLTLALGIGACTAIFSLVNAVLIRSLPYGDPERLVYLFSPNPSLKIPAEVICPSYGDFYDLKREANSYANMSNFEQVQFSVTEQDTTQRMGGARVDENFFATLQSMPELGRGFAGEDNLPAHAKVAVISHSLWGSMFGATPDVLHRSIQLDGANYRIVGVMPPEFEFPFKSDLPYGDSHINSTQIWVPLALSSQARASRAIGNNVSFARLRSAVSIHQAQAEMAGIMARLDKQYAADPGDAGLPREWGSLVESFTGISIGPVRPLMRLLLAAVGLVLLIACGNVASLLLGRAAERARELSVRAALGAGRGRMVRQLLTESMLLGVGGCSVGIVLALFFLRLLPKLDPGNIPRLNEASLDARVFLVAIGGSLFTSLLAGLMPAIGASRMQLTEFLKSHAMRGSSTGHSRSQSALIVAQTAMVVVLLAGAGLLIRSYINVASVDTGFTRSAVTFHVSLDQRYSKREQHVAFYKDLMAKLEALPGVGAAGGVSNLPLSNSESIGFLWVDGFPNKDFQQTEGRGVTPHYFEAMEVPLIAGRYFTEADTTGNGPTIINQKFAATYFPNRNPIGGRISTDDKHAHWSTVVGVVADVRHMSLEEEPQPQMYNTSYDFGDESVAVRSTLPAATVENEIRATLKSIDPSITATDILTMGDLVSVATARRRFQTSLLTVFAGIALIMALVGLSGLMTFSVNRRTREVGIRMALGADRRDVLLLILRNASVLVIWGLVLGLACTSVATRLLKSFLFGVAQYDPFTFAMVSVLLVVCGLMAALVPARRAASIDPMQALRAD
ncbi:MAG: ABC transporter permease [Terracidiphilus sp.]|jgi:predicted permease